mmetsp:Transcript_5650/g.8391  ORF Transcript_5650/g.8391 Transcript_5650/m.8391 type:complete len:205 (-) Transcript_5650:913-1527(-)
MVVRRQMLSGIEAGANSFDIAERCADPRAELALAKGRAAFIEALEQRALGGAVAIFEYFKIAKRLTINDKRPHALTFEVSHVPEVLHRHQLRVEFQRAQIPHATTYRGQGQLGAFLMHGLQHLWPHLNLGVLALYRVSVDEIRCGIQFPLTLLCVPELHVLIQGIEQRVVEMPLDELHGSRIEAALRIHHLARLGAQQQRFKLS